jgi:hypothetical protein
MARIVTVYRNEPIEFCPVDMSLIRWLKISEALARLGHQVDIATNENRIGISFPVSMGQNLRRVHLSDVRWHQYDVVKTLFHGGFLTLEKWKGTDHPFIISKLGSVVAPEDRPGIYFYGSIRESLYSTQSRVAKYSRYITLLSGPAVELWKSMYGSNKNLLLVPGAVDRNIPEKGPDPFPADNGIRAIFSGNIYTADRQPEANRTLSQKLNLLGELLFKKNARLYFLGPGDTSRINPEFVTVLGPVPYQESWNYLYHVSVGVVLNAGPFQHNNESSKIYHYLRSGLPVVCEAGFPNEHLIGESGLGYVTENGNMEILAERVIEASHAVWDRDFAVRYILENHTWDHRAQIYHRLFQRVRAAL